MQSYGLLAVGRSRRKQRLQLSAVSEIRKKETNDEGAKQ